jgi:hopanoid biosynthesis associated protein HpnK
LKTLILTGDDFGRSAVVNAAIERYHAAGALTQASLMVNEPHAAEAAQIAARHPQLRVGLHLTLCAGRASRVSALTDDAGNFEPSPAKAGLRYFFSRSLEAALTAEIRAQFEKFRALGFAPTYWDGHTHLHLHPTILRLTLPIAKEHGFRFIRLAREPGPPALVPWIFQRLSAAAIPALRQANIAFADQVFGLRNTGRMTLETVRAALAQTREGVTEIYFHPGAEIDPPAPDALASLVASFRPCPPRSAD